MERTSIYTGPPSQGPACPNCELLHSQLQELKAQLVLQFQEIEAVKPTIIEMLEGQDMMKYEDELIQIRGSYERLRRRVDEMGELNQQLTVEKRRVEAENRKLRGEAGALREEVAWGKEHEHEQWLEINGKGGKVGKLLGESIVLSELSANTMDRTANVSRNKPEREGRNGEYLGELLERRVKIQEERHRTIEVLSTLLTDV
jgi:hypothetical protein